MKEVPAELDLITDVVLAYRPKGQPAPKPRKRQPTEWQGAICKTCYRPIVGIGDDWRHMDGRVRHAVVVRELSGSTR